MKNSDKICYGEFVERFKGGIPLYSESAFKYMRKAGEIAADTLDFVEKFIVRGTKTEELDALCAEFINSRGATSACLGYKGFPKSVCISVNHVVCHGIPSSRALADGDIVNIDVTVIFDGWYGDTSKTFCVGKAHPRIEKLVEISKEALEVGIKYAAPGNTLSDIGREIQKFVEENGFSVVRDFCGHGIGRVFHDLPQVLHFYDKNDKVILEKGMIFTIEPMVNAGKHNVKSLPDGWTVVTKDRSFSSQFEHTIGITAIGCEVFTKGSVQKQIQL
ncbi:type I methionyl aminopeptidase [Candidatus Hydrogenosomobacter endosymbioticus]|nr:type I methionyl aminopeptidase [Candidatus Hydrogenosomobacter endosymbioticus]